VYSLTQARKRFEEDQTVLRALRMGLRDVTACLCQNRQWRPFRAMREWPWQDNTIYAPHKHAKQRLCPTGSRAASTVPLHDGIVALVAWLRVGQGFVSLLMLPASVFVWSAGGMRLIA
jgi:hypothetical protein